MRGLHALAYLSLQVLIGGWSSAAVSQELSLRDEQILLCQLGGPDKGRIAICSRLLETEKDPAARAALFSARAAAKLDRLDTASLDNGRGALEDALEAVRIAPRGSAGHVALGRAYAAVGDARAVAAFNTALTLDPRNGQAYRALADFYEAKSNIADAKAILQRGLAIMPDDPLLNEGRALLAGREDDWDEVVASSSAAFAAFDKAQQAAAKEAERHKTARRFGAQAAYTHQNIMLMMGVMQALRLRAYAYVQKHDYAQAIEDLENPILLIDLGCETSALRGEAYLRLDRKEDAVMTYDRIIAHDAACAPAYLGRAAMRMTEGAFKSAEPDLLAVVTYSPDSAEAWHYLGDVYARTERRAQAIDAYDKAAALGDTTSRLYNDRCYNLALLSSRLDQAEGDCRRALAMDQASYVYGSLGLVLLKRGNAADALAAFEQAAKLDPSSGYAVYGRGIAKRALRRGGATEDLTKGLAMDPASEKDFIGL